MTRNEYIEGLTEFSEYLRGQNVTGAAEKNAMLEEYNKEQTIMALCDISVGLKEITKCLENITRRMPK